MKPRQAATAAIGRSWIGPWFGHRTLVLMLCLCRWPSTPVESASSTSNRPPRSPSRFAISAFNAPPFSPMLSGLIPCAVATPASEGPNLDGARVIVGLAFGSLSMGWGWTYILARGGFGVIAGGPTLRIFSVSFNRCF